jgi:hypothetical protein
MGTHLFKIDLPSTTTQYGEVPMENQRAANSQAVRPFLVRKSL